MKKELVSIVSCKDYKNSNVKKALIKTLKNIDFKIPENKTILIKPNVLSPAEPNKAITTHPIIIQELCKLLKTKNNKLIIGDSSAYSTDLALKKSGIIKLAKYAKIINFEGEPKKFFNLGQKELNKVPMPKIIFNSDLVINIAKLKTHGLTRVTLCIKNLYGCIPGKVKDKYHKVLPDPKNFSKFLIKIEEKIKPELNIIDGIIGLEGEGPGASGNPIKSKIIIASKKAAAADIIASEIMGFKPKTIYTNKFSKLKKRDIETIGKITKLNFKKPKVNLKLMLGIYNLLPKPKIAFNTAKCIKCGLCSKKCPVNAIILKPYPECNHKKCIRCLCCIEVCPKEAIYLEKDIIRKIFEYLSRKFTKD